MIDEEKNRPELWTALDLRSERRLELGLRVLAAAQGLAEQIHGTCAAVLFDNGARREPEGATAVPIETALERLKASGATKLLVLEHPELDPRRADLQAQALARLARERRPRLILAALGDHGRELLARTACELEAGLIADAEELRFEEGRLIAGCPAWGGEVMAEISFCEPGRTGLVTVRPRGVAPNQATGPPPSLERIAAPVDPPRGLRLVSSAPEPEDRRRLEEAETVVVGGAGLGGPENFGRVRELAAALGGELGATRPPALSHWVSEERLIGQTGKTVRPRLLLSVGTSGAVQYTAGITEAGTIVAINRDPEARIFELSDLGIVADAGVILPLIIEKVKRRRLRHLADLLAKTSRETGEGPGFGAQVQKLREGHGLTREALAQLTSQSPEFIEQVEKDEVTPSVAFLLRLARALGVDPGAFLTDREKEKMRDRRSQDFVKRTQNYSYQTLTPGAENERLRGFMITIEPRQAHKPVAYKHEGEEFIFMLEGELELTLGGKVQHLKPGESIHFNSEVPHKLRSVSDAPSRCLVVLYTP